MVNLLLQSELTALAQIFDPDKFNSYLILGYIVMWVIVMIYVFLLWNKQRNSKEDIQLMKQLLMEDEETESS